MGRGIDYGMGTTNIDRATGIRYGVIPAGDVCQAWADSSESDYGPPTCGACGNELTEADDTNDMEVEDEFYCDTCETWCGSQDAYGDEPIAWTLDDGEYKATQRGDDTDIFILKSPYFTRAQFCSPCAPGACHLNHPTEDGERAYCFGHDWFEDGKAPYPVYSVATGELIPAPEE